MPKSIEELIDRELRRWEHERQIGARGGAADAARAVTQPIITISRQHGSRGKKLALRLAGRFGYTLLHRDLIDRISTSTGHRRRLLEALDEHARSQITTWVDAMLSGRYLDESDYVVGLLKTVHSIALLGGVVVVGRGANFIVEPGAGVHLRVVAPLEERVRNLMKRGNLTPAEAAREIKLVDEERAKFVRRHFHRSVDDPVAYDMIINESGHSLETLVALATTVVEEKLARLGAPGLSPVPGT